jgi:hypothetical protein
VYAQVRLECPVFPEGLHNVPESNSSLIAYLRQRWMDLQNEMGNIPQQYRPVILDTLQELIGAAELADSIQRSRLQFTHSCMKLAPNDEGFKREYDIVDREMLRRTGVPEIHSTEVNIANTLKVVSEKAGEEANGLADAVKALIEQNRLMMEALAQRQADPPAPSRHPERRLTVPTNEQNVALIRARLGNPLPSAPDDQILLRLLTDQLAHHSAQLVNTRNHWSGRQVANQYAVRVRRLPDYRDQLWPSGGLLHD